MCDVSIGNECILRCAYRLRNVVFINPHRHTLHELASFLSNHADAGNIPEHFVLLSFTHCLYVKPSFSFAFKIQIQFFIYTYIFVKNSMRQWRLLYKGCLTKFYVVTHLREGLSCSSRKSHHIHSKK